MEELKNMLINLVLDNILEGVQQLLGGVEEVALIRPTIIDAVLRIRIIMASRTRIKGAKYGPETLLGKKYNVKKDCLQPFVPDNGDNPVYPSTNDLQVLFRSNLRIYDHDHDHIYV